MEMDAGDTQSFRETRLPPPPPIPATRDQLTALRATVTRLEEELEVRGREIDTLQAAETRRNKPWWRDTTTLVSVGALALTVLTVFLSRVDAGRTDDAAKRDRLTNMIQRITGLQRENAELQTKYPANWQTVASVLNTDRVILTRQAGELIKQIPDLVNATEYYAVGLELSRSGETALGREMLDEAVKRARNYLEYTAAVRQQAEIRFGLDDLAGGRALMARAGKVFEEKQEFAAGTSAFLRASHAVDNEVRWALLEQAVRQCVQAREHATTARRQLSRLTNPDSYTQLVTNMEKSVAKACD